jgi:hypothetical protein
MRYARQERIKDSSLREAVVRAERGLVDSNLGGGIIKQRVGRPGRGRSGGYRMLIAYRSGDREVFLYGFAKKERENIGDQELASLREIASAWLKADGSRLEHQLAQGLAQELDDDEST